MIHKVKVYHYCKLVSPFTFVASHCIRESTKVERQLFTHSSLIHIPKNPSNPPITYYPNIKHPPRVEDPPNATRPSSPI